MIYYFYKYNKVIPERSYIIMSKRDFYLIYIGYLTAYHYSDPIVLCVGDRKDKVKYYLEEVRGLSKDEYYIREGTLDWESACSLYEDYILYQYDEKVALFLTERDLDYLNDEIKNTIHGFEDLHSKLQDYIKFMKNVSKFYGMMPTIENASQVMQYQLGTMKNIKKISREIIRQSPVMSKNILEYLHYLGYMQESRELVEEFYRKLEDERS